MQLWTLAHTIINKTSLQLRLCRLTHVFMHYVLESLTADVVFFYFKVTYFL